MEQEQQGQQLIETQQTERRTFKDKVSEFFKGIWTDKIKCVYVITILLQIVFIILQFVPVAYVTTSAKKMVLFDEVVDVEITNEKISVYSLLGRERATATIFWAVFALLVFSLKATLGYFFHTGEARYKSLRTVKVSAIGCLILYLILCYVAEEMGESYAEYGSVYQSMAGGTWYVLIAVAVLVSSFILSAWIKTQKEKERIETKVQEKLQKERVEQNEPKSI